MGRHANQVRQSFRSSPILWAADDRHYVREIRDLSQAEVASAALRVPTDLARFYFEHQDDFGGDRPRFRAFVVHDKSGSVDGTILVERDGFCWRSLGVTWPRGRKRPTRGLRAAVEALCRQEGICGVDPSRRSGRVNRSTLGKIDCDSRTTFCEPESARRPRRSRRPTTAQRRAVPEALFALPKSQMSARNKLRLPPGVDGAYPMDTMARARSARSYAVKMLNEGYLTLREAQVIFDRTAAHTADMVARGARGWRRLAPKAVVGSPGEYRSVAAGSRSAAANEVGAVEVSAFVDGNFTAPVRTWRGFDSLEAAARFAKARRDDVRRRGSTHRIEVHRAGKYDGARGAAANRLPSRDRKGRFVSGRKAAPGLLDYPGGGGHLPSRDRRGRFVSERRRAPALGSSAPRQPTGFFARLLGRGRANTSSTCICARDGCGCPPRAPGKVRQTRFIRGLTANEAKRELKARGAVVPRGQKWLPARVGHYRIYAGIGRGGRDLVIKKMPLTTTGTPAGSPTYTIDLG